MDIFSCSLAVAYRRYLLQFALPAGTANALKNVKKIISTEPEKKILMYQRPAYSRKKNVWHVHEQILVITVTIVRQWNSVMGCCLLRCSHFSRF